MNSGDAHCTEAILGSFKYKRLKESEELLEVFILIFLKMLKIIGRMKFILS